MERTYRSQNFTSRNTECATGSGDQATHGENEALKKAARETKDKARAAQDRRGDGEEKKDTKETTPRGTTATKEPLGTVIPTYKKDRGNTVEGMQ